MVQRVAIYARVSTNDQSCERQLAEIEGYVNRNDFEVIATFKEIGSGAKNDRTERKKVIELARHRKIDLVLVSELSRWGRSTPDLRSTIERLAECGVALRALNGPDLDISTAQGRLMMNLLASISEFERDLLRERIKSGVAHARSKGTKSGEAIGRPAFGESGAVNRLLSDGKSIRQIASELGISKTTVLKVKKCLGNSSGKSV
jgi:putative DNA-invertase from lambdoid prophage Rac